ncbi:MAG: hypothetical protein ACJAT7_001274 [Psychromonas sp.]|jgi:hypothetical protein
MLSSVFMESMRISEYKTMLAEASAPRVTNVRVKLRGAGFSPLANDKVQKGEGRRVRGDG